MQYDPRMRDWTRLVGETGDLADIVVAVLSLASADHNVPKVDLDRFYGVFSELHTEFPDVIPDLDATTLNGYVYSRVLADALENALRLGVQIANPRFQYLEISQDRARTNLERIGARTEQGFLEALRPVAGTFAQKVQAPML
jgi:hypothetical protein